MSSKQQSDTTDSRAISVNETTGEVKTRAMTPAVIAVNCFAGIFGPVMFAPLIAIVDGSIINSVNGDKTPVLKGMISGYKMLFTSPRQFFRKESYVCGLCWMVYAGTYSATNNVRSYAESRDLDANATDALKFSVSLLVNLGLTQVKDVLLVREFARRGINASKGKTTVPMMSRGLFLCRDGLTMFAAFCLSDRLGSWLYERYSQAVSKKTCVAGANFVVPAALQPISTFFHLWALENAAALKEHRPQNLADLKKHFMPKYGISTLSRVARIVPAISVGNNVNMELRSDLLKRYA